MSHHRFRVIMLAIGCALLTGCFGDTRPKQKLLFTASPLPGADSTQIDMDRVKQVVTGRLRAARLKASFTVEVVGPNKLAVTTRSADQESLDKIKDQITVWAQLEFAEVAHTDSDAELLALANEAEKEVEQEGVLRAEWLPLALDQSGQPRQGVQYDVDVVKRDREVNGQSVREWLILYEPGERVTGDLLASTSEGMDDAGNPAILFSLNALGAGNMSALTTKLRPQGIKTRKLAIILNGRIYSAPSVQSTISSRGQITGFNLQEVRQTVEALRFGSVPCQLTFVELIDENKSK